MGWKGFWAISGAAQDLLLAIHSGTIPGDVWGSVMWFWDQIRLSCVQGKSPTHCTVSWTL